jgi:arylsulfatase A-like enzyme
MRNLNISLIGLTSVMLCALPGSSKTKPKQPFAQPKLPNIIYILSDDLGYGDITCNNPQSKIRTPNIDRLAAAGVRFTDAHSTSGVCSPTRYSIITGRYCWRTEMKTGVLRGYGRPLIEKDRPTVATLLKDQGYTTAAIGKWHLGLNWILKSGHENDLAHLDEKNKTGNAIIDLDPASIDVSQPPSDGPATHGFDYSFILPASLDMPPYCYLKNDTLTKPLTGMTDGKKLDSGYTGSFWRPGLMAQDFEFDRVLPTFVNEATNYIRNKSKGKKPYFLYLALTAPHTPWLPADEMRGKTGAGEYGDFVYMVDLMLGKILKSIEESGQAKNTIVIFTSDNGPYWRPNQAEQFGHKAAGPFRGMKGDTWEAGHRIPFIVRWPGKVAAGTTSHATTTLANLMATVADITSVGTSKAIGEDSYSILPVLLGKSQTVPNQEAVVHHSSRGLFAIRKGDWKLIEGKGSGGFSTPSDEKSIQSEVPGQLYNLRTDTAETINLYAKEMTKVVELTTLLEKIKKEGNHRK